MDKKDNLEKSDLEFLCEIILLNLILDEYGSAKNPTCQNLSVCPKPAQHHPEILEKVLSFQILAHSLSTWFQRFID